jgi:hypothetical protein
MTSCIGESLGSYQVKYALNKWVKGKNNTPLFVFDNLKAAKDFSFNNELIYECVVKNPRKIRIISFLAEWHYLADFWKAKKNRKKCLGRPAMPHTIICDEVKLIKKVW